MNEMRYAGYTHNYMRMYWGKKFLGRIRTGLEERDHLLIGVDLVKDARMLEG